MKLEIITPEKKEFDGEVNGVKVPGTNGSFEVLNDHAPIISTLSKGSIRLRTFVDNRHYKIDSGVIEVSKNKAVILVEKVLD